MSQIETRRETVHAATSSAPGLRDLVMLMYTLIPQKRICSALQLFEVTAQQCAAVLFL